MQTEQQIRRPAIAAQADSKQSKPEKRGGRRPNAGRNVVRFRRGKDARSIPPIRITGEKTRDAAVMVVKLAELLREGVKKERIHTMFIDSAASPGPLARGCTTSALGTSSR